MTKGYPDWMRAFLLLGKHNSSYLPVLLGADGSMYAVLQGEYEGTLRTVKLDDEGRLSAFVIDSTDQWGAMLGVGNAELAARLGSPLSYDRRGQLLFIERWDSGKELWIDYVSGDGAGVEISPNHYMSGGYGLKMVTGANVGNYAKIERICALFPSLRVGIGMFVSMADQPDHLDVVLGQWDGTTEHQAYMRYTPGTKTIQLLTTGSAWVTLATEVTVYTSEFVFNYLKLVADFSTGCYARVIINEYEYDASAIPIYTAPSLLTPNLLMRLIATRGVFPNTVIYVDDVALTTQEP
jgi:hypothetical protein